MRRDAARLAAACLLPAALAALCACSESHSQEAPAAAEPLPKVIVQTLRSQPVPLTRELAGRTRASVVAEVRPQVSAIVKRLLFVEGSYVKAGQPLYELDDARYRAQLASAQAGLQRAGAALQAAQQAAARTHELARIDAVSAQDNESATSAEAQARADVAVAQAAVDSAKLDLGHAHIVAPIGGRIGKSAVTQGALVTAEQAAPLATIQQLDPAYVEVNESSSDWLALRQDVDAGRVHVDDGGAVARIVLENGSAYEHDGKLQFSDVTVDAATGNFLLRVAVPNPKLLLLPGMYVRAIVGEGTRGQGLLVPQQSISRDPGGNARALVVGADGKVATRQLVTSGTYGANWVVESGLQTGDRVIVQGVDKVRPGMTVKTVDAQLPEADAAAQTAAAAPASDAHSAQ